MRYLVTAMWLFMYPLTSAVAQVSVGVRLPSLSIGIDMPVYPRMVPVPGYPVYYAPGASSNYFFYDGLYWVYEGDSWYSSSWYNGPWMQQTPDLVPAFILRVPVSYYRHPPAYFAGWRSDAPPRWGEHWGTDWQRQHRGWDTWSRGTIFRPAPLPAYQRRYSGARYPQPDQQDALHSRNYTYHPRDITVRKVYQTQRLQGGPPPGRPGQRDDLRAGNPQQHADQHARPGTANTTMRASPPRASRNTSGHAPQRATTGPKGQPGRAEGDDRRPEHNK